MGFSKRIGKVPIKSMQFEAMDAELKTSLWNVYLMQFLKPINKYRVYDTSDLDKYFEYMWQEYFKFPIHSRHFDYEENLAVISKRYSAFSWHEVYDFIEFHTDWNYRILSLMHVNNFIEECNRILQREFSAYRVIDRKIAPIANQVEFDEVSQAIGAGVSFLRSKYKGVNIHLGDALTKLSDKKQPDYRNSIKESISAVEALCRQLTDEATLGEALKNLEKRGLSLNPQLKSGLEKLYAFTNSKESGIRHAMVESPMPPSFDDAKFMLVTCSAFINLLVSKSSSIR